MNDSYVDLRGELPRVAYALVKSNDASDPRVLIASDVESIGQALALEVIASTQPERLGRHLDEIQKALLERRWADALVAWMEATDCTVDVFPDEPVVNSRLYKETLELELQFKPIFRGPTS